MSMRIRKNIQIAVVAILALSLGASGCLGVQAPVFPQNMMRMEVPMQSNPVAIATPDLSPHNITANATNVTTTSTVVIVTARGTRAKRT